MRGRTPEKTIHEASGPHPGKSGMGHKTDILDAVRGIRTGKLPYAPRFDLWFNAHRYRGTLPEEYRDCRDVLDIARKIGVGGHLVIADFIRPEHPSQTIDRGLGLYSLPQFPYRITLRKVERKVEHEGAVTKVAYITPKGRTTVCFAHTEEMRRAGASISNITKHAVTSEEDFPPLIHIFDHIEIEPDYDGLRRMTAKAGEDALVVANGSLPGSPMQFIMRDLMDITSFFYALHDIPGKLKALADAIGGFFERIMPVSASCPCDIVMFGANTDETITFPPFYEEHIMPWISRFAAMAHENGKFVLIHADGENHSLFRLYRQTGIDVLEAVATSPMTKSDIHEVLAETEGMTVWGGIPSVILMPETYGEADFERFVEETLDAVETRTRFILGVSDTTPPDADFRRLLKIRDMVRERNGAAGGTPHRES